MKTFHSNGKLLLTGEYTVLDGATALAIPTVFGQTLTVSDSDNGGIHWISLDQNATRWYEGRFYMKSGLLISERDDEKSKALLKILSGAMKMNPQFLNDVSDYSVTTKLDFPRDWGLGTSSTLVNNIAQWAEVDAIDLLKNSFGGSGYDIAAAKSNTPIVYQNTENGPEITPVVLSWDFTDQLFFVHLNEKQDSKEGIALYRSRGNEKNAAIIQISEITKRIRTVKTLDEFCEMMSDHESIVSKLLGIPKVKDLHFSDYRGIVKSLGAWGGDFVLASGSRSDQDYFREKGYTTIIPYLEMLK